MTPRRVAALILLAGFAAMLALNAPGQLSYDSVTQLADGRSTFYNSWHPPLMAFLLGLFDAAIPGTVLFLIFQSGLLLLALLALLWLKPRGWIAPLVALAIVLTPQWLLYQGEIWKDMLFADAAIAGFAALAVAAQRSLSRPWLAASALLLTLAACTRQNGVVLLPVAAVTLGWIAHRQGFRGWIYAGAFLFATIGTGAAVTLALAARGDGGDGAAAQLRLGQSYDLTGAFSRAPALVLPLTKTDPALDRLLRGRGAALYTPLHNDPMAADPAISQAISDAPGGAISGSWQALVLGHPALYLQTRLTVFAALVRTPDAFACHFAPVGIDGDPALIARLGLKAGIRPQDKILSIYARAFFATPVYSHLFWGVLALVLM
ncbi:MAG: hypothetical protein JWN16_2099, partial [Alphaproteobacteria bacterium]|nr:hypothetical protein [Alphaproteobacteria bacterium]